MTPLYLRSTVLLTKDVIVKLGPRYDNMLTVCCATRRRSPAVQQKRKKPPAKRNMLGSVASLSSHKTRDSGEITVANRIISFGKMPSYKCVSHF